jgi:hypothetical protein
MKKLFLLAVMLITAVCAYSADFPRSVDAVQDFIYAKLGNQVSRATLSIDKIDVKTCNLQYQACKDDRALLRVLVSHINAANQLMQKGADGNRGILVAYAAFKCADMRLKDKELSAGIAVAILLPNINLATDDYNSGYGRLYITNDILNAVRSIDDDDSIVKIYKLIIDQSKDHPNTSDAYRIVFADYQYNHARYVEALAILNAMTDKNLIDGVAAFKIKVENKVNKAVN